LSECIKNPLCLNDKSDQNPNQIQTKSSFSNGFSKNPLPGADLNPLPPYCGGGAQPDAHWFMHFLQNKSMHGFPQNSIFPPFGIIDSVDFEAFEFLFHPLDNVRCSLCFLNQFDAVFARILG